jgi:nucleoside-diphosphate-sugar epimerase
MSGSAARHLHDCLIEDASRVLARVSLAPLDGGRVLVTGASGLLGSHILACLAAGRTEGVETDVLAVSRGEMPEHLPALLSQARARVLRGNLVDPGFRKSIPEVDCVIHAAAYAQPALFMADPVETLALGTEVTLDLLRRTSPGGSFLFLSSSEVYSGLSEPPFREDQIGTTTPAHPRACYIESKRAGEAACHAFATRGIAAKVARVSLAYGPGTRPGDKRVLNAFIEAALTRGEISMRDSGRARRTYAYVSDVVELLWSILLRGRETVYNVGGEATTTIADLARAIASLAKARAILPQVDAGVAGAPDDVRLDLTRTREEFGKRDYVSLGEGLARTIGWQRLLYGVP